MVIQIWKNDSFPPRLLVGFINLLRVVFLVMREGHDVHFQFNTPNFLFFYDSLLHELLLWLGRMNEAPPSILSFSLLQTYFLHFPWVFHIMGGSWLSGSFLFYLLFLKVHSNSGNIVSINHSSLAYSRFFLNWDYVRKLCLFPLGAVGSVHKARMVFLQMNRVSSSFLA